MYEVKLTARRVAAAVIAGIALVAVLVGLDALTGGSSHVTHAADRGPLSLAGELAHRVHVSAASIGSSWRHATVFACSVVALAALGTRRPHFPAGDALLVGIVVSLLVNDSPGDVAAAGALSYAVLWAYEWVREPLNDRARAGSVTLDASSISPHP
jgi:MFS superfamily sulfate permease-like transporter